MTVHHGPTLPGASRRLKGIAGPSTVGKWLAVGWLLLSPPAPGAPCGSMGAWSQVVEPGVGSIFTDTDGAMAGTLCGLVVVAGNDTLKRYVQDDSPAAVGPDGAESYRLRFYFDPNGIALPADGSVRVKIAVLQTLEPTAPFVNMLLIKLKRESTGYVIRAWARNGTGATDKSRALLPINDGPNVIEVQLTVGAGDGIFRLWVNNDSENAPDYEDLTLNNAAYKGVDRIRLGHISGNQPVTGRLYFDEVVSRTTRFIGSKQ